MDLKINNNSVSVPTGNFKFSRAVSGFGESGVATGQFEFDLYDEFDNYSEAILAGASARLYESNGAFLPSREYYISKRSVDNHICHFVAYDVMSKADEPLDMSAFESYGDEDRISCGGVMGAAALQCGFASVGYSDSGGLDHVQFTKAMLKDKTVRGVMEMIAEAMCGVWGADNGGGAVLSCFGQPYDYLSAVSAYSEINMRGAQKITKLIVTDTESGDVSELSTGEYGTVFAVETPFAGTAPAVWERIRGKLYTAWSCEKALLTDIYPDIPSFSHIVFGERELLATSFTVSVDSTGVYFSGGSDPQDEEQWRYEDYTQRQLSERVQIGRTVGNVQIGRDTLCFVNKNKSAAGRSADAEAVEKYAFSVGEKGVTEYDGAIVDKTDFEYAEKLDNNTAVVAYPGGVKYKCTRTIVGGKHYYKKERIDDNVKSAGNSDETP